MSVAVAYVSRGKLFVRDAQGKKQSFDSRFGQQVRDRAVRRVERNAWKTTARARGESAPALVPGSWKLMRMRDGQAPEELASAVLSFDLCPDGAVIFSNGSKVERLSRTASGKPSVTTSASSR